MSWRTILMLLVCLFQCYIMQRLYLRKSRSVLRQWWTPGRIGRSFLVHSLRRKSTNVYLSLNCSAYTMKDGALFEVWDSKFFNRIYPFPRGICMLPKVQISILHSLYVPDGCSTKQRPPILDFISCCHSYTATGQ